jgi:hypothetical protein
VTCQPVGILSGEIARVKPSAGFTVTSYTREAEHVDTAATERTSPLRLSEVLRYLEDSEARLVRELSPARDILNSSAPAGWTIGQIVQHLIMAEKAMLSIWKIVPKLERWPAVIQSMDRANRVVWRAMGMRILEPGGERILPANATEGRFRAPVFLSPRNRPVTHDQLLEDRGSVRARTLRAIGDVPEETLGRLRWSLPHSGSYTLLELVQFIGIHENHHLPQIQRIRARHEAT